jgi:hypothetical protein
MFLKIFPIILILISGCAPTPKIAFDINRLDGQGLQGNESAKRSLSYEYCAPKSPQWHSKISAIDPSSRFMENSRGRSGCSTNEMLVLGDTHQKNFAEILTTLSELKEIKTIRETHFE